MRKINHTDKITRSIEASVLDNDTQRRIWRFAPILWPEFAIPVVSLRDASFAGSHRVRGNHSLVSELVDVGELTRSETSSAVDG